MEYSYLIECSPYDPNTQQVVSLGFSKGLSEEAVSGAAFPYPVRVQETFSHETSIFEENIPGQTSISLGAFSINNVDGRFDHLLNYNWDERVVRILRGKPGYTYAQYTVEFTGYTTEITADDKYLVFSLTSSNIKLAKPIQTNKYLGAGGSEGSLDLKGRPKPLLYSTVRNATPILLDPVKLTFQLHDGPLTSVSAVYDRANPIYSFGDYANYAALEAANIPAGKFGTNLSGGYIRLGAATEGSPVVDAVGPHYHNALTGEALQILINKGGLTAADFETADWNQAELDMPYAYEGLYFETPDFQMDQFLETIVSAINGYWYVSKIGKITVGIFKFSTPVESIREEDVNGLGRLNSPNPIHRIVTNYAKNPTVQSINDFVVPRQTFNGFLTKSHQFISTAANGTGGTYTTDAVFEIFLNNTKVNDFGTAQFKVLTNSPWCLIDGNGVITITDPGVTTASATIRANYGEFFSEEVFTVERSLGALKTITLTPDSTHIVLDSNGIPVGEQDLDMTVTTVGTTLSSITAVDNLGNVYALTNLGGGIYRLPAASLINSPMISLIKWTASDTTKVRQTRETPILRGEDGYAAGILSAITISGGGASAIVSVLTNEAHTVASAGNGTVASYANAGGTMRVYNGLEEVTNLATFSVMSTSGLTMTIDANGVYTPSALVGNSGTAVLQAVYETVTMTKVYSLAKTTSPVTMQLTSSAQVIPFLATGVPVNPTEELTFTAFVQPTGSTVSFSMVKMDGTPVDGGIVLDGTGLSRTLSHGELNTARGTTEGVIVKASVTYSGITIQDQVSIVRVQKGEAGADAKMFILISDRQTVQYDSNGTIYPSQDISFLGQRQNTTASLVVHLLRMNNDGTTTIIDAGVYITKSGTVTDNNPTVNSFTQTGTTLSMTGTDFNTAISGHRGVIVKVLCDGIEDSISVSKVRDGSGSFTATMTNEAHTVAADQSGVLLTGELAKAVGTMKLFYGSVEVTAGRTFTVVSQTGVTGSTISTAGAYALGTMSADTATVGLRVAGTHAGQTYSETKTFTVSKAKQGSTGPSIALSADKTTVTFVNGVQDPAGQVCTITASVTGITGTINWETTPNVKTGTGATFTISGADMGTNESILVRAVVGTVKSSDMTITKLASSTSTDSAPPTEVVIIPDPAPAPTVYPRYRDDSIRLHVY